MGILVILALILLVFWLGGFIFRIAGGFIHIILVLALVLFAVQFFR